MSPLASRPQRPSAPERVDEAEALRRYIDGVHPSAASVGGGEPTVVNVIAATRTTTSADSLPPRICTNPTLAGRDPRTNLFGYDVRNESPITRGHRSLTYRRCCRPND